MTRKKETIVIRGNRERQRRYPLPGVTILIKGSTVGVSTDVKGEYVINVEKTRFSNPIILVRGNEDERGKMEPDQQTLNVVLEEEVSE